MKCFKLSKITLILGLILFGACIFLLLTYKKKEHLENLNSNVQVSSSNINNLFANIIANITNEIQNNSKTLATSYNDQTTITGNLALDTRLDPNIFENKLNNIISGNIPASNNISNVSPNVILSGSYVDNFKTNIYGFGDCKDNEIVATNCPYWATAGDCLTRADYMNENCKKSCGKC